jgi:hypothetical protein
MARKYQEPLITEPASLGEIYSFDNESEVFAFLKSNQASLVILLHDIHAQLLNYFPLAKTYLQVVTDPEIPDDVKLFVKISPQTEPDEAWERLKQFKREWWFSNSDRADGKLAITLEYR